MLSKSVERCKKVLQGVSVECYLKMLKDVKKIERYKKVLKAIKKYAKMYKK